MGWVVTYLPCGHRSASSTRILPPPSVTSRVAHGSGTHAPTSSPLLKAFSVVALSCGRMETSPPPVVSVLRPFDFSHVRSATSWVLPSCGDATLLPLRSAALLMDGLTTRYAPPDAAPEMIFTPLFNLVQAVMVGLGPM